jgi:hypothetical protein
MSPKLKGMEMLFGITFLKMERGLTNEYGRILYIFSNKY